MQADGARTHALKDAQRAQFKKSLVFMRVSGVAHLAHAAHRVTCAHVYILCKTYILYETAVMCYILYILADNQMRLGVCAHCAQGAQARIYSIYAGLRVLCAARCPCALVRVPYAFPSACRLYAAF